MKTDINDSINFLKTGFKDYLSARVLLNNNLIYTGSILASTSVEKYLKAVMSISGNIRPVHLDNLSKIKDIFKHSKFDILDKLDIHFLELLGKIYKFRYYDNIRKGMDGFGFPILQFIGSLDYTIHQIESSITINGKDGPRKSDYEIEKDRKNQLLIEHNYILNNLDKKEFMEQPSSLYTLIIGNKKEIAEEVIEHTKVSSTYNGHINVLSDFRM